jgi:hypothetical protein
VNTTSESPKPLPLVHHLPSIDAGVVLVGLDALEELLAGFVVLLNGDVVLPVLGLLVGFVVAPPVVLPPAGCDITFAALATVSAPPIRIARKVGFIGGYCDTSCSGLEKSFHRFRVAQIDSR